MLMVPDLKAIIDQAKLHFNGLEVAEVEKVVLTKDQATELESFKRLGCSLEDWVNNKNNPVEPYSVIHDLSLDQMAKVLYHPDGYEVEQPKFKAGDKVMLWGGVVTLKDSRELLGSVAWSVEENNGVHLYASDLVRATPEEVYWLGTLGREKVGDFRKGDVIKCGDKFLQVFENMGCDIYGSHISPEFAGTLYSDGSLYAISPAESFKPLPKEEAE